MKKGSCPRQQVLSRTELAGQITKVLNMRPGEILQLVEEAAGTRLYESKKEAAQKTIQKKETKLAEIDKVCVLAVVNIQ